MFLWVEIQIGLTFGQQVVERRIEDTNDLGTLVIHDCMRFLVPENRDSEPCIGVHISTGWWYRLPELTCDCNQDWP